MSGLLRVEVEIPDPFVEDFAERLQNMAPAFEAISPKITAALEENIEKQDGGDAGPWRPLTAATIKDRVLHGFPAGPPLQKTGALKDSISDSAAKDSAEAGPGVSYAGAQNAMRQFVHLTDAHTTEMAEAVADYIVGESAP